VGILLLAVGLLPARAQSTADAYFHEAAQQYVADDVAAARRTVERGLEVAPSDPRLLALRKKLRQGGRPQGRRDSSSTGQKDGSQNSSSSRSSSKGGETPSTEQSGAARSGRQDAPPSDESGASSAQRPSDRPARADTTRRGRGGRPVDTLSRAQAERLLQALEGQERQLLRQLRTRSSPRQTVEKDW
jgi:hypothetical protein